MSRLQPTLAEAIEQVAAVEYYLVNACFVAPCRWSEHVSATGKITVTADGFWVNMKRQRYGYPVHWPMSDVSQRCDDCRCVLRASRDAGGQGFYYDKRWLTADPAVRDPRLSQDYQPHYVCLSCLNRARPALRKAYDINEIRLMLNRIKKETRHAA